MAETDAKVKIIVEAEANVKSAEKAANDTAKNVLNTLKDGRITIPAVVEAEFDKKPSQQLIQAQKAFLDQWKDMSSKGFSSSAKDLDDLIYKYTEFKRLMKDEHRRGNKQNLALSESGIGTIFQPYNKAKKTLYSAKNELKRLQAEVNKGNFQTLGDMVGTKPKKEKKKKDKEVEVTQKGDIKETKITYNDTRKMYREALDAARRASKERKEEQDKKLIENLGLKTSSIDLSRDSGNVVIKSAKGGGYDSTFLTENVVDERKFYEKGKHKATRKNFDTLAESEKYVQNQHENVDTLRGKGTYDKLTEEEKNLGLSKAALDKISKTLGLIVKNNPSATLEDFAKYLEGFKKFRAESGKSILDTIFGITNKSVGKYFHLEKFFDYGKGENDYTKDFDPEDKSYAIYHNEELIQLLKDLFATMKNQLSKSETDEAERLRQRRMEVELTKTKQYPHGIAPEDNPRNKNKYGKGVSISSQVIDTAIDSGELKAVTDKAFKGVGKIIKNVQDSLKEGTASTVKATKDLTKVERRQLAEEKASNIEQEALSRIQSEISEENKIANVEDLATGLNTDAKADELINAISDKDEKLSEKEVKPKYTMEDTVSKTISEGIGDMMCPCETVLQNILKEAAAIHEYIKAIMVYLAVTPVKEVAKKVKSTEQVQDEIEQRDKPRKKTFKVKKQPVIEQPPIGGWQGTIKSPIQQPPTGGWGTLKGLIPIQKEISGLPALYKQMINGKLATSGVKDHGYSENLKPLKELSKAVENSMKQHLDAITSDKYYEKMAKQQTKDRHRTLSDQFRESEKIANEASERRRKEQLEQRIQRTDAAIQKRKAEIESQRARIDARTVKGQVGRTIIDNKYSEPDTRSFFSKMQTSLNKVFSRTLPESSRILRLSEQERARESAARLEKYGETRNRGLNDTGDIARMNRRRNMFLRHSWSK